LYVKVLIDDFWAPPVCLLNDNAISVYSPV
jgi:hypothetical protein